MLLIHRVKGVVQGAQSQPSRATVLQLVDACLLSTAESNGLITSHSLDRGVSEQRCICRTVTLGLGALV